MIKVDSYNDNQVVSNIVFLINCSGNINGKNNITNNNPIWKKKLIRDYNLEKLDSKESQSYFFYININFHHQSLSQYDE